MTINANGTTTLFAALDVKGDVIGRCVPRHRHHEFLKFFKAIDRSTPKHLDIHGIADNTRPTKNIKPRIGSPNIRASTSTSFQPHHHVKPCGALVRKDRHVRIRRGVFTSVPEL